MDDNEFDDCPGLGIDPTIRPLLGLRNTGYPFHMRACASYSQWLKAYDADRIAWFFDISVEAAEADIDHIKRLLSDGTISLHFRERREVQAAKERSENACQKLANDLSLSADALIARGQNPINVLKRFREAMTAEDPRLITELRKQNSRVAIDEVAVDLTERDNQLIAALRREAESPAKRTIAENPVRQKPTDAASTSIDKKSI